MATDSGTAALGAWVSSHPAARAKVWLIPGGALMAAVGVFIMSSPFLFPDPRLRVAEAVSLGVLGLLLALLGGAVSVAVWRNRHRRGRVFSQPGTLAADERGCMLICVPGASDYGLSRP